MDLNQLVKDLEEIKGCIENDHIEKAEDLLGFVIGEVSIAAQHHAHLTWLESHPCNCTGDDNFCHLPSCPRYIATQVA